MCKIEFPEISSEQIAESWLYCQSNIIDFSKCPSFSSKLVFPFVLIKLNIKTRFVDFLRPVYEKPFINKWCYVFEENKTCYPINIVGISILSHDIKLFKDVLSYHSKTNIKTNY